MSELFLSGRALDLALLVILVELGLLAGTRAGRRRSLAAPDLKAHLWSALALLLAAHLSIARAHWGAIALSLLFAGIAHLWGWQLRTAQLPARRTPADPTFSSRLIS